MKKTPINFSFTVSFVSFGLIIFLIMPSIIRAQQTDTDTSGAPACAVLNTNLRYGTSDASVSGTNGVSILQDFLNTRGYLNSQPTGFFGHLTFSAVQSFQRAYDITPTGFVGPITRAKIRDVDCNGSASSTPITVSATISTSTQNTILNQSIQNQPSASVILRPQSGETLILNSMNMIRWNQQSEGPYIILLEDQNGIEKGIIDTNVYGDSVNWQVGWVSTVESDGKVNQTITPGTYKIQVIDATTGVKTSSQSSGLFTIISNPSNFVPQQPRQPPQPQLRPQLQPQLTPPDATGTTSVQQ